MQNDTTKLRNENDKLKLKNFEYLALIDRYAATNNKDLKISKG